MAAKKVTPKVAQDQRPEPPSDAEIATEVTMGLLDALERAKKARHAQWIAQQERNRQAVKAMPLYFMQTMIDAAEEALFLWMKKHKRSDLPSEVARIYDGMNTLKYILSDTDHSDDAGLACAFEAIATGVQYVCLLLDEDIDWGGFRFDLATHEAALAKKTESKMHRIARERKMLALARAKQTTAKA